MKFLRFTAMIALLAVFSSCVKDEEPNAECDIVRVIVPEEILLNSSSITITNSTVDIYVKFGVDVTALAPEFELTPGATIDPASGTPRDFTDPQLYTVTSEDRKWSKTYTVTVIPPANIDLKYSFDDVRTVVSSGGGSYDEFFSDIKDPETGKTLYSLVWASGNSGFALTAGTKGPDAYPTYQGADGWKGKCVVMVTRSTGTFGAMVKKPLAAGNLFLGNFNTAIAVAKPREATEFGVPFYQVPMLLSGMYKYTPGATYQEPNEAGRLVDVPGVTDKCNIYGVLYELTADVPFLNGDNILSDDNPNTVAVARLSEAQQAGAADWTPFILRFNYREGKTIDAARLANGGYGLAVVMSSSANGDYFAGAVGSVLMVDELEITCLLE